MPSRPFSQPGVDVPAAAVLQLEDTIERLQSLRDGTFEHDYPNERVKDVQASALKHISSTGRTTSAGGGRRRW